MQTQNLSERRVKHERSDHHRLKKKQSRASKIALTNRDAYLHLCHCAQKQYLCLCHTYPDLSHQQVSDLQTQWQLAIVLFCQGRKTIGGVNKGQSQNALTDFLVSWMTPV